MRETSGAVGGAVAGGLERARPGTSERSWVEERGGEASEGADGERWRYGRDDLLGSPRRLRRCSACPREHVRAHAPLEERSAAS